MLPKIKPKTNAKTLIVENKENIQKDINILPSTKPVEEKKPIEEKLVKNIIDSNIILPLKKPITYKKTLNKQEPESKILSKKDYEYAKEVFYILKRKKMEFSI